MHTFRNAKRPIENANPVAVAVNMNGSILQASIDKSIQMISKLHAKLFFYFVEINYLIL